MAEENERVKKLGQGKSKAATVVADESTPPDKGGGGTNQNSTRSHVGCP